MRSRALLAALGVLTLAALALGRGPSFRPAPPRPGRSAGAPLAPLPEASAPDVDPEGIRDVFRFAGERAPVAGAAGRPAKKEAEKTPVPPSSAPRLVGLVLRSGRLLAALAGADGEVELAGAGERAAGVTVVSVGEDGVRVRRPDGSEETLLLP